MSFRNSTLALTLAVAGACFASCLEFSRRQTKVCGHLNQDKLRINFRRLPLPVGRGYGALQQGMLIARIIMSPNQAALIRLWREKRLKHRSAETVTWRFKPSG